MKRFAKIALIISLIFTITTCSPSPQILADCFISFNITTWYDLNDNGLWDSSEPPLEGVEFHIDGQFASVLSEYPCISNEDGECNISTWAPGMCEAGDYWITVVSPEFYKPTTPTEVMLSLDSTEFSCEVKFGFTATNN